MRIRWTPPAAADMQSISEYLRERHPQYRQPTMRRLYEKIRALKDAPSVGRPGRIEGTREILFPPCLTSPCTASTSRASRFGVFSTRRRTGDERASINLSVYAIDLSADNRVMKRLELHGGIRLTASAPEEPNRKKGHRGVTTGFSLPANSKGLSIDSP
jgi:plasmid stabilization system protein ParE